MAYLEPSKTSYPVRWSFFTEIVNGFQPLIIFAKSTIVTVRLGSKFGFVIINLTSKSATLLQSKATKINEVFTGTLLFSEISLET